MVIFILLLYISPGLTLQYAVIYENKKIKKTKMTASQVALTQKGVKNNRKTS